MSTSERLDRGTQALAFIRPNTVLCASSPARLCSSLKCLSPPHVPKPTDSSYPYSTLLSSPLFSVTADNFYLRHRHHTISIQSSRLSSPVEASSLLLLLQSNILQLQRTRDESDFTAFFHQTADPPVIVELLQIGENWMRKHQRLLISL